MDNYTIYCSEQQTKRALELGAPIKLIGYVDCTGWDDEPTPANSIVNNGKYFEIPTAEQMIGWLRGKNILFRFDDETNYWSICDANDDAFDDTSDDDAIPLRWYNWSDNKELGAIDVALEYLMNNRKL